MTRFFVRCMALVLALTCCCAFFTVGASAADPVPSGSATWTSNTPGISAVTLQLGGSGELLNNFSYQVTSLVLSAPSAGTLVVSLDPCLSTFRTTGNGSASSIDSSLTGNAQTLTVVFSKAGSAGISVTPNYTHGSRYCDFTLVSWTASGGSGGGEGGGENPNPYPESGSRWVLADNKGNWVAGEQGQQFLSTSNEWQTYNQYIGDYVTKVKYSRDGTETEENSEAFMARMLSDLSYSTWDWSVSGGKLIFFPPENAEGSWLDNMWRMNVTMYYNLVNNSGWFGMVTSNQSSIISQLGILNTRVLQILSVLANDEDVKIKDATTYQRTWIQNYFEGNDPVGPSADNFTDLRSGFGSITDQFETDKSITDIGSVFSDSAYDSRSQFFFWSQTVSDDVNGVSRGGFGGGKASARAPVVPDSTFSDQYEYGDDSIVDAFDFIGGASDG